MKCGPQGGQVVSHIHTHYRARAHTHTRTDLLALRGGGVAELLELRVELLVLHSELRVPLQELVPRRGDFVVHVQPLLFELGPGVRVAEVW